MEHTFLYERGGMIAVIVGGALIVLLTFVASASLVRLMYVALRRATGGDVGGSIVANIIRVAIWVLGLSILLKECLNIDATVMLGALGVGGIALSLGMQNTLSSLIGGLQASFSRDVALGDWVKIGSITGQVKDITWRVMKIADSDGNAHIIPNSMLSSTSLTVLAPWQPVAIALAFSRNADIARILEAVPARAKSALEKSGYLHEDKDPVLAIDGTSADSVNATLQVYASHACSPLQVKDCVMPPILDYLRSINAACAKGDA